MKFITKKIVALITFFIGLFTLIVPTVLGFMSNPLAMNASRVVIENVSKQKDNSSGESKVNTPSSADQTQVSQGSSVQERQLTKPYTALGTGIDKSKEGELKKVLLTNDKSSIIQTDANDTKTYTDIDVTNEAIISSVSIAPQPKGSGIIVNIADFEGKNNITQITKEQYAMVATMAGLKDVLITISADRPVSGHGALTGIYKALSNDGIPISNENSTVANKMLDATSDAIQAKPDNDYPSKISGAIVLASSEVAKGKEPETALKDQLEKAKILEFTPQSTIDEISSQLKSFSNTPVAKSKDYPSQVSKIGKELLSADYSKNVDKTVSDITGNGKNFIQKTWTMTKRGYERIYNWIVNFKL